MKQRLLLFFFALLALTQTAKADDYLYAEIDGTAMTLKYGEPGSKPYYSYASWSGITESSITEVTIEASCASYADTSLKKLFNDFTKLTTITGLANLGTTNVTNMNSMFKNCKALATLDLSGFSTAGVTDMSEMFYGCTALTTLNVSSFNTSSVTTMSSMFRSCNALTTLDVSSFNTSSVTDMAFMFYDCTALTSLNVSNFNTSNVTNMSDMFGYCEALPALDLSNFDISSVSEMYYMFTTCRQLKTIITDADWSGVTNGIAMFYDNSQLVGEDGTAYSSSARDKTKAHTGAGGYFTKKTATLTANDGGDGSYYATYYKSNVNRRVSEGTTIYKADVSGTTLTLTETGGDIIKAGEAVILVSTGSSITLTSLVTDANGDYSDNALRGAEQSTAQDGSSKYYALSKKSAGVGFYRLADGVNVPAHKAYLRIAGSSGAPEHYNFSFDDEDITTGINAASAQPTTADGVWYDLTGRRTTAPTKGLYIKNGQKYIIK